MLTYNSLFLESGIRCQQDGRNKFVITKYWNDGKQPRVLAIYYDTKDIVLLVAKCCSHM